MVDAGERADVVLETVLTRSGYLAALEESDDPQDETRVENLAELVAVAREFATTRSPARRADPADVDAGFVDPGLGDFLERVSLVADTDQIPDDEDGVVTLMTLHTAKGLEFPVVFLTGLEDGVFPHSRSLGDRPELEEERRLAYVGITRARERLYVSRALVRSAWGAPSHNPRVPVPRRAAGRPRRLAPHRGRADPLGAARPAPESYSPRRPGSARRRRPAAATSPRPPPAPTRQRKAKPARADPGPGARRPGHPRQLRPRHRRRRRGRGREVRGLDRLRQRGRQAAAAALRAGGEALRSAAFQRSACDGLDTAVATSFARVARLARPRAR